MKMLPSLLYSLESTLREQRGRVGKEQRRSGYTTRRLIEGDRNLFEPNHNCLKYPILHSVSSSSDPCVHVYDLGEQRGQCSYRQWESPDPNNNDNLDRNSCSTCIYPLKIRFDNK